MPNHCFCEAVRIGIVRQPANAVSSLAFVVVGVMVLVTGYRDRTASDSRTAAIQGLSGYALVYASALIVVGIGSAFYHASLSFIGQFADVMGMYLIASFVILYSFGRIRKLTTIAIVGGYVSANAALAWLLFTIPLFRRYVFAGVLLTGLGVELAARRRLPRGSNGSILISAVVALAIGFAIWIADITRVVCAPHSILQGHALWHVAGAFASWRMYAYYRSPGTFRSAHGSCTRRGRMRHNKAISIGLFLLHATSARLHAQDAFADRRGSGTSWIPVASPMPSHATNAGGWSLRMRGAVSGELDVQSGPRGSTDVGVTSWGSLEASRSLGRARIAVRGMLSLDALGVGEDGFAQLLQTGDAINGVTSHDRMLPREFLTELALTYDVPLSSSKHFTLYIAPAGEPALGPPAFTQRPSAMDNPVPPIGFHRQDSPRTSWGVITAGVFADGWKFEASRFNGRQPNAKRFNVEKLQLDSYSARLTMRPEDAWSASVGAGYIHTPNPFAPEVSTNQFTAALMNARRIRSSGTVSSTLIYSATKLVAEPFWSHSLMFETTAALDAHNSIVARLERVHKGLEELDLGSDGNPETSAFGSGRYHVGAATVGYVREVATVHGGAVGVGVTSTLYLLPSSFSSSYGSSTPAGVFLFVRVRPAVAP